MYKIYYHHTVAPNGGFGVLGKGIAEMLKRLDAQGLIKLIGYNHEYYHEELPNILFTYGMPNLPGDIERDVKKHFHKRKYFPFKMHYAVWESSKLPEGFADAYKPVDLLMTATQYTQQTMRAAGLNPVIWHHGVDDRFQYRPPLDDGIFTFLHYNAYEYRKGWELVLQAFTREFHIEEPVKLIMKARERKESTWVIPKRPRMTEKDHEQWSADREYFIKKQRIDHPLIEEVIGHISDDAMVDIMQRADCFVFPAKGEGWGLPPFEAAACGIVPILPNRGCFTEWFNKGCMLDIGIAGYLNSAPRYPGYMYYPSVNSLRRQMRAAYEESINSPLAWATKGKLASMYVRTEYNWEKIGREFYNILTTIDVEGRSISSYL